MHLYRQTIALFGIIVPVAAAAALVGLCFLLKSNMAASFDHKQKTFKISESARLASVAIGTQVNRQREHTERRNLQLSQETASAVTTNLREILSHLPTKEIQQTALEPSSTKAGFGIISAQNSSQIRIAFRGTYRTMQRAFLELETRMPRLQLQDLKIDPSTTQSSLLNFQVSYTAWEN